jgi:cardiolipin synthase (CMP-forming)
MTIPNLITAIRIILAPVFIIFLINDDLTSALLLFLLCGASDCADGMIARLLNQKSKLGTYLDPLADKLLLVSAFVVLAARGNLPAWLTVMVIARDILILLGVVVLFLNGLTLSIKPSIISKINTCLQFTTVVVVLSGRYFPLPNAVYSFLYYVTAAFTISSGLDYMRYGFQMMGEGATNNKGPDRNSKHGPPIPPPNS